MLCTDGEEGLKNKAAGNGELIVIYFQQHREESGVKAVSNKNGRKVG